MTPGEQVVLVLTGGAGDLEAVQPPELYASFKREELCVQCGKDKVSVPKEEMMPLNTLYF